MSKIGVVTWLLNLRITKSYIYNNYLDLDITKVFGRYVFTLNSNYSAMVTVKRSYIWVYASFQFVAMLLFSHIFYTMVSNRKSNQLLKFLFIF